MLTELSPSRAALQLPAFATEHEEEHTEALLGDILDRFGAGAMWAWPGGMTTEPAWLMRRASLSPR
ncbi:hypothetical protein DQ354_18115 [Arthrobacter sp. AQ5-06]|nr:hypothetical protein DQ354_18115 [Arthrobacter sp. AQ5-06]